MNAVVNGVSNSIILFGDYDELHSLPCSIDNIIAYETGYKRKGHAIDDSLETVEKEIRGTDDADVACLHGASEAHPRVLVEERHDNVCTACRAIVREHYSQSRSTKRTSYEHMHELVLAWRDDRVLLK